MPIPSPRGADAAPHPAKFSEPELAADTLATVCKIERDTDGEEDSEIEIEIEILTFLVYSLCTTSCYCALTV